MKKSVFITFIITAVLVGCTKQSQPFETFEQARAALQVLNSSELTPTKSSTAISAPVLFSEPYLAQRHQIYQSLMQMELTDGQAEQVKYLVIAERFPERYFSWPAQFNILQDRLSNSAGQSSNEVASWLNSTLEKLKDAAQSELKLNKVELAHLQQYLRPYLQSGYADQAVTQAATQLYNYLLEYRPRGLVGLRGLANGSDWYQSKLNYFSTQVAAPLQWLNRINNKLKSLAKADFKFPLAATHQKSFIVNFLADQPKIAGLDWLTQYLLLPQMAQRKSLNQDQQTLMLALMETDIGIHFHAWTFEQAQVSLMKRVKLTPQQAAFLVTDVVLYPAHSFSFASQILLN